MPERQITSGDTNHILTHFGVWSPEGDWIYYDVRSVDDQFDGNRIERVQTRSREVEVIYQAERGAKVGVVTASPIDDRIVFIHGPEDPTEHWRYAAYHRRGVVMNHNRPETVSNLDARDIVDPFTAGALRGGSHVHVFNRLGTAVSFTYEDHVLATTKLGDAEQNQRNVGVSFPIGPVTAPKTNPRNHDGTHFTVLVTRTWDQPQPNSDQIDRAYEDAWLNERSIVFIGDTASESGKRVPELFVVSIPSDPTIAGGTPLQGTSRHRPAPPAGTTQTRLTRTHHRRYPGLAVDVRHWPLSDSCGETIAMLMRDYDGIVQLWLIQADGTGLRQLTHGRHPVASAFSWRRDNQAIACVIGHAVCEVEVSTGRTIALTEPSRHGPPSPTAVVYSPDGRSVAFTRDVTVAGVRRSHIFIADR